MAEKRLGTLITLIAGIAWGLSGVSGQYLMSRGVSVDMITSCVCWYRDSFSLAWLMLQ